MVRFDPCASHSCSSGTLSGPADLLDEHHLRIDGLLISFLRDPVIQHFDLEVLSFLSELVVEVVVETFRGVVEERGNRRTAHEAKDMLEECR
jgi:hypothetical protein